MVVKRFPLPGSGGMVIEQTLLDAIKQHIRNEFGRFGSLHINCYNEPGNAPELVVRHQPDIRALAGNGAIGYEIIGETESSAGLSRSETTAQWQEFVEYVEGSWTRYFIIAVYHDDYDKAMDLLNQIVAYNSNASKRVIVIGVG